jgi:phospholipid-translocating ATPase
MQEVAKFHQVIAAARANQEGREQAIADIYERIESGHTLLNCAGIEDRLQEGVSETIEMLHKAGIHVGWSSAI